MTDTAKAPTPAKRVRKPRDPNAPLTIDQAMKRYDRALHALEEAKAGVKKAVAAAESKLQAAITAAKAV